DKEFESQKQFDDFLISLDGTENKSKLGANAILPCSIAFCKAAALRIGLEPFEYIGMIYWDREYSKDKFHMPRPQILMMEGGKHGNWATDIQEYMIVPKPNSFETFSEILKASSEIFYCIENILDEKGYSTGVGYEGAFAPREIKSNKEALDIIMDGIQKAGYTEKFDMALDIASSELFNNDTQRYELKRENKSVNAQEWITLQSEWYSQYPVFSIEDPLDENSWEQWSTFTKSFGDKYQIVGDDLLVTNTKLIQKGINQKAMNAVLIKLNQIGTVSETLDAIRMSVNNGMQAIVSHRSGETIDSFIADIVVGTAAQQSKFGAVTRGERVVKYNRLLEIEEYLL
ncbi:MAG TPA: phosphopyruvate hydratase, partial [Candidatus Dojkabacteria bacterium]|nr:phosphopyruvate hydratase [Candidatus Dojkabacteria bacterium]